MSELRVGWAKREITPAPGYGMSGYVARRGASIGVLDPLYVRVLLLEKGASRAAIVVADVLLISSRWGQTLRHKISTVLRTAPEFVIAAATHTHSGPLLDMHPFDFSDGLAESDLRQYSQQFEQALVETAREAASRACPAKASFATIEIEGVATDRNRRRSSRRQSLFIFRFEGAYGTGLFAVFGCHPTVLGADNRKFSGDLHGEISRVLETESAVALVANGAAGNISTRFIRKKQSPAELKRLAATVAKQVSSARFKPLKVSSITARIHRIVLPLADLKNAHDVPRSRTRGRELTLLDEGLRVRKQLSQVPDLSAPTLKTFVTTWRVGPITIAALPWEIYSNTGKFLWKQRQMVPVCYANGYCGYLPSATAANLDYEVVSSPFARSADQHLRESLMRPGSRTVEKRRSRRKNIPSEKPVVGDRSPAGRRSG